MSERRRKRRGPLLWLADRSRRFWIIAAALPILYAASFGPACWIYSRSEDLEIWQTADRIYYPILWQQAHGPDFVSGAIDRYANLCSAVEVTACWPTFGDPRDVQLGTVRLDD